MIHLPEQFVKIIKDVHNQQGEQWLKNFDSLIDECEKRWQLKIMSPFDLSYNFVAPALTKDGTEIVIKLAVPNQEFYAEVEALSLFNGEGMVKMIDADLAKGILLLERLFPGNTLASLDNDVEATYIAAEVMKKLWVPAPISSGISSTVQREKSLINIYQKFPKGLGPITKEILEEAIRTFTLMNRTNNKPYLLHGDLHHYNILKASSNSWLAIDPKGLIGDREYDVIQFILNKLPTENITGTFEKRIDIFVQELNLDKKRILLWGFSHAVLSTSWSIEEGSFCEPFFDTIEVFKKLYSLHFGI